MIPLVVWIMWLEIMPQFALDTSRPAVSNILKGQASTDKPTATLKEGGHHD